MPRFSTGFRRVRVKRTRSNDSCASPKAEERPYSVRGCWTRYEGCSVECTSTRSRNCFTPVALQRERERERAVFLSLNLFHPRSHSRFIPTRRHPQRAYHAPLMPNRLTSRMIILLPHVLLPPPALIRAALTVIFSVPELKRFPRGFSHPEWSIGQIANNFID